MQTNFRKIRVIIAEQFQKKQDDPQVVECATKIIEATTGKTPVYKDPVAGWLSMDKDKEAEMKEVNQILTTFETELRRADDLSGDSVWQDFARGFVRKELKTGHDYHVWLTWFRQDPERMAWAWKETPQRIKSRWLMAFDQIPSQKLPSGV